MNYRYKKEGAGKYVFLGITALVCFLVASSVLPFGAMSESGLALPDIMLCFVCALPAFTDLKKGSIYALSLGFLADLFINPPTDLSPIVFLGCMLLSNLCQKYFSRVGTLAIAISTIPCILLKCIVSVIVTALTVGGGAVKGVFASYIPMGVVTSFAMAIALSFVMRVICKKLKFVIND
ncbi:MAG: hypothetical protein IJ939_01570 [Clostridia bacterium]|nr:hypothetical protein [Clostridia bacterium]